MLERSLSRRFHSLLILGSTLWLLLVLAAPILEAQQYGLSPLLYGFFKPACHQIAERSFFLMGSPLAVCHRCFGLYLGFWITLGCGPLLRLLQNRLKSHSKGLLLFAIPLAVDMLLTDLNSAGSRFATGSLAGVPLAFLLWQTLNGRSGQKLDKVYL